METDNIATKLSELENEHRQTIRAVRIGVTILLTLVAAWCGIQGFQAKAMMELLNAGGATQPTTSMLKLSHQLAFFLTKHGPVICGIASGGAGIALFYIWRPSSRLPQMISLASWAIAACVFVGWLVGNALPPRFGLFQLLPF